MKQNKYRIFALFGAALLLGSLYGCKEAPASEGLTVVTTVYASYDLAKQLTAEFHTPVNVTLLLTPGGESHSYEPSPMDVAAIQSCDLFVYIGGASEQWAEQFIDTTRKDKANLRMFDHVNLLEEETKEGMEPEADDDEDETELDEHIWTAPLNADAMLLALRDELIDLCPDEADACGAAYETVHTALLDLDAYAKEIHENERTNTLIFADRFPFRYLTDAYGWDYFAAFPGCSSDTDASAATLSFLIQKIQEDSIGTVFYLENSSQKISRKVCEATGAKAVMLQSCNNVSAEILDSGQHFQDLMHDNLSAIQEALS